MFLNSTEAPLEEISLNILEGGVRNIEVIRYDDPTQLEGTYRFTQTVERVLDSGEELFVSKTIWLGNELLYSMERDPPENPRLPFCQNDDQESEFRTFSNISLCRPVVFCSYEAYEKCANESFSACESCRFNLV